MCCCCRMGRMRVGRLLNEIEPLAYPERCRRLADLRERVDGTERAKLLDRLGARGHYERSIALTIASAARDEASLAYLRRAVRDPDADLAGRAIALVARLGLGRTSDGSAASNGSTGPDEAIFRDLLDDAPAAVRAQVYKAIRSWRRRDLAEALIDEVTERWGDAEGAALLPACGEQVAAERLDGLDG